MTLDRQLVVEALAGYDVGDELGRGACGIVLGATHRRLNREVAIKQLPRAFGADPEQRRRFTAEAQLLASFDHPHIVPIFDYVEHEGLCLLVMERLTGGTLWDRMHEEQPLAPDFTCAVVLAACTGLQYAHERGVLHRDVKPENLMFASSGTMKVTDFGIAKVVGSITMATLAGDVVGTPAYIAPEQAQSQPLTPGTDVYALGSVLFELLAGELPYAEVEDPVVFLYQHVHEDPRPLERVKPSVAPALAEVVNQSIQRDPSDRYPSAEAFGTAVARAASQTWGTDWLTSTGVRVHAAGAMLSAISSGTHPALDGHAGAIAPAAPSPRDAPRAPETVDVHTSVDAPATADAPATIDAPVAAPAAVDSVSALPPIVASGPPSAPSRVPPGSDELPATTPPPIAPAPSSVPPSAKRGRGRWLLVAALVVLVITGGVVALVALSGDDDDPSAGPSASSSVPPSGATPTDDEIADRALLTAADIPPGWTQVSPPPRDEPTSAPEAALAADVRTCAGAPPRDDTPVEVRSGRFADPEQNLFAESRASVSVSDADARSNFELFASPEYLDCLSSELPNYLGPATTVVGVTRLTEGRPSVLDVTGYQLETQDVEALNPGFQNTIVIRRGRLVVSLNLASADGPFPADVLEEIATSVGDRLATVEQ